VLAEIKLLRQLLLALFVIFALPLGFQPVFGQRNTSEKTVRVEFFVSFESLNDRIPGIYTSRLSLALYNMYNQSFRGELIYQSALNRSLAERVHFDSRPHGILQEWSDDSPGIAFDDQAFPWTLLSRGEFPYDTFTWYMVLGCDYPIDLAKSSLIIQPSEGMLEVSARWQATSPQIVGIEHPIDFLLQNGVDPVDSLEYRPNWYILQVVFSRQNADIQRFTFLYWVPAEGLLLIFLVTGLLSIVTRRGHHVFQVSPTIALTLYLGSAFFAFPFILTINQYAPPFELTLVERLFYLDVVLAFAGTTLALILPSLRGVRRKSGESHHS
jgi:hypothetical protein